ncbi:MULTISPECIES: hypothetical protein [Alteromonadaceae]|uniref:Uncharacterized protein n=1 Tax=Brumicola blandensis TaxID=3075611 RepID=A0AAW8R2G2_9ALTE|nr:MULTISPECIES: hypothetical protein [unclassified Alteromonas]MDT0583481.1 hypothetical protein [Alteromonas sp. W409]MDT0629416.1 hypothetical protein [Alteromonas sp. W364]
MRSTKLLIVANVDSELSLTKQEVKNLFMGGVIDYDLRPITLTAANKERTLFHARVLGLTDARVRSYWAQMRFSGRKQQPDTAENEAQALEYVTANAGTITYIKSTTPLPEGLVVVYRSN